MTSAPIMWFSTLDFEYEKDEATWRYKKGEDATEDDQKTISITDPSSIEKTLEQKNMKFLLRDPELYDIGI